MKQDDIFDSLLQTPVHIIDILPQQVPKGFGGQYFDIEEYLLQDAQRLPLFRRFAALVLKLNCYYDLEVRLGDSWQKNPPPAELVKWIVSCGENVDSYVTILIDESSSLSIDSDSLYIACYNLTPALELLLSQLVVADGLFLRRVKE